MENAGHVAFYPWAGRISGCAGTAFAEYAALCQPAPWHETQLKRQALCAARKAA